MRSGSIRGIAAGAIACAALVGVGCGGGSGGDNGDGGGDDDSVSLTQSRDIKLAMVTHGDGGSFWSVVKRGAEQAAEDQGIELQYSESTNDPQQQAQMIEAAVTSGVDGIAVSVPAYDAVRASLEQASAADIPIIMLNAGQAQYEDVGAIGFVGQDESVAGEAVGERLAEEGKQNVICVIHEQSNSSLEDRCNGVKQGLGGGTVTNVQVTGTADIATSQTEMQSKLSSDDAIDAVVTLNGEIADAATGAIQGANSEATLATFDLSGPVIEAIKAGTIDFAVDQQQYLQGYMPIVLLSLYKSNLNTLGGGMPVLTGPSFVDADNADAVADLAEAGTR